MACSGLSTWGSSSGLRSWGRCWRVGRRGSEQNSASGQLYRSLGEKGIAPNTPEW